MIEFQLLVFLSISSKVAVVRSTPSFSVIKPASSKIVNTRGQSETEELT